MANPCASYIEDDPPKFRSVRARRLFPRESCAIFARMRRPLSPVDCSIFVSLRQFSTPVRGCLMPGLLPLGNYLQANIGTFPTLTKLNGGASIRVADLFLDATRFGSPEDVKMNTRSVALQPFGQSQSLQDPVRRRVCPHSRFRRLESVWFAGGFECRGCSHVA